MKLTIDLKNYEPGNPVSERTAARGIIRRGEDCLMIFSKYGDYKFPGGGMENGESLEETLIREVKEETGYQVIKESIRKYGQVLERRKGEGSSILEMDSHYYVCDIREEAGERNLDEYEKEYDYQIVWIPLKEALENNNRIIGKKECPWAAREAKVMELMIEKDS